MTTPLEDVQLFHTTFNLKDVFHPDKFPIPDFRVLEFRKELIEEECVRETLPAFHNLSLAPTLENMVELADGLIDTLYVTYGALVALEFPTEKLWKEVQRSNMSKMWDDGLVHKREDGKVLKPPGFTPPDLHSIMLDWMVAKLQMHDKPIMSNFNPDLPSTPEEKQKLIDRWNGIAPTDAPSSQQRPHQEPQD